jgi:cytochrome o ubiquinol oxidase subunit IV
MEIDLEKNHFKPYIVGLILSLALTLAAYFLVDGHLLTDRTALVSVVVVLAVLQALVQMMLFLHLGTEGKPHWNMLTFLFMVMVVLILVLGSLWIMYNLSYDVMPAMGM